VPSKVDWILVAGDVEPLKKLLAAIPQARGTYVRRHGKSLIIGRKEPYGPRGGMVNDDRLKLMARDRDTYSLRFMEWNGRWASAGFEGPLPELADRIGSLFGHYLTPQAAPSARTPKRTSGRRHASRGPREEPARRGREARPPPPSREERS
jgi:hypothetical protein